MGSDTPEAKAQMHQYSTQHLGAAVQPHQDLFADGTEARPSAAGGRRGVLATLSQPAKAPRYVHRRTRMTPKSPTQTRLAPLASFLPPPTSPSSLKTPQSLVSFTTYFPALSHQITLNGHILQNKLPQFFLKSIKVMGEQERLRRVPDWRRHDN